MISACIVPAAGGRFDLRPVLRHSNNAHCARHVRWQRRRSGVSATGGLGGETDDGRQLGTGSVSFGVFNQEDAQVKNQKKARRFFASFQSCWLLCYGESQYYELLTLCHLRRLSAGLQLSETRYF